MTSIDPKLRKALTGISGILVTPFDRQDRVAPARLAPIVDHAIGAGVHILVANGNTGEFYGLTTAEAETMVHAVAEMIAGRVPLLAGVGRSINDACALARASRSAWFFAPLSTGSLCSFHALNPPSSSMTLIPARASFCAAEAAR